MLADWKLDRLYSGATLHSVLWDPLGGYSSSGDSNAMVIRMNHEPDKICIEATSKTEWNRQSLAYSVAKPSEAF